MTTRVVVTPQQLHLMCVQRYRDYDKLPTVVKRAIQETKWNSPPDHIAEYLRMLAAGETTDAVISLIKKRDALATEIQYRKKVLSRECGDAPRKGEARPPSG